MRLQLAALALLLTALPTAAGLLSGRSAAVFAFPNPARTSTIIRFQTDFSPLESDIEIFDVAGNLVREIRSDRIQLQADQLTYHAPWDLTNSRGQAVAAGVYLVVVKVKGGSGDQDRVLKKVAVVR